MPGESSAFRREDDIAAMRLERSPGLARDDVNRWSHPGAVGAGGLGAQSHATDVLGATTSRYKERR